MSKKKFVDMNMRLNTLLYTALFSALGVFSYLLLINYTNLSERIDTVISSAGALLFFMIAFNVLGYFTLKISSWIDNQYSLRMAHRWKFVSVYALIMVMFLVLNYGLLVAAKLLAGAMHPFVFLNGGERILLMIWLVELIVLGLLLANRSMQYTLKLQKQAADLQKENNTARYTALQNQLNPHFLFNSLNTLISEIRYNPKNAELFTQNLSDVYRYILQCQEQQLVTLQAEIDFLSSYIFLHQVRLGNCISIDNRIPANLYSCKVPPLTLQLLIENVIKHNTIHTGKPMTIELFCTEDGSELIVRNLIRPKKSVALSGVGLKNLSARYFLLCNRKVEIDNDNEYFTVKVPLIYE